MRLVDALVAALFVRKPDLRRPNFHVGVDRRRLSLLVISMCVFGKTPSVSAPAIATQAAAPKAADMASAAGSNMKDRLRSAASTVLTSGSGVTKAADTAKKTLLGA